MIRKKQPVWQKIKNLTEYSNYIFPHKINTLKANAGSEGVKHFLAKSVTGYILRELKKDFMDEVIVNNGKQPGRIDLISLSDGLIFEFETNLTQEIKLSKREKYDNIYIKDFVFINLSKLPDSLKEMYGVLKQKIIDVDSD
jgi:hypothetical protein